jgi:hypothetical protein
MAFSVQFDGWRIHGTFRDGISWRWQKDTNNESMALY